MFHKLWWLLRTYILTLRRFDLFLQGALLVVLLLETNSYLLLRRNAGTGSLTALVEDWVLMASSGAEFLLGSLVGWFGGGRRNLVLSMWLGASATAGLLMLAVPFPEAFPPSVELCGGETISAYSQDLSHATDSLTPARVLLLALTVVLCSLTRISIWAHGLTYLDDHDPKNGVYFYGILISIRLSLGLSGESWLRPGAVREDWWEAHLSLSMLVLMFAVLFTLFPKRMQQLGGIDVSEDRVDTGFITSIGRVLSNKAMILQTFGLALLSTALFGFVRYDSAYVQARFHVEAVRQDPRTSRFVSDIFRSLVVIFFVMIFRVRFSERRSDGVKANTASRVGGVVAIFVAVFFGVLAALNCGLDDIAGMEGGTFEQLACSADCDCNSGRYGFTPVCALDTSITYFSPCTAGCTDYEDLNGLVLFHNCTCGSQRAVRGSCTLPSCRTAFAFYQIFYTVVVAVTAAAMLMQGMVMLRAVRQCDKPVAMGTSFAIVALVSQVPGHMLYMLISYLTCAFEGVGDSGCVFHQPTLWAMAVVSSALALLSGVVSILASRAPGESSTQNSQVDDD